MFGSGHNGVCGAIVPSESYKYNDLASSCVMSFVQLGAWVIDAAQQFPECTFVSG